MRIEIIDGIKYRLDEDKLTAEVSQMMGYKGDIIIPETVVFNEVTYRVTRIGEKTFDGCSSLTSIVIPDSVTSIGESAFRGCSSLTSIVIPDSVTSIEKWTFWRCSSLTSIVIPDGVTSIREKAFYFCDSLKSITIPASVTCIGEVPGSNDPYRGVLKEARALQGACPSLTEIIVAEGNTVYDSRENCNALIHTATNTLVWGCQNTIIPDSVTSIQDRAFDECSSLTSIVIPESVEQIGSFAFEGCSSLTSIVIHDGVKSIGESAFNRCSSLSSIVIPNSVTSIGKSAFGSCDRLEQMPIMEVEIDNLIYRLLFHNQLAMRVGYSDAPETIVIPSEITHEGVQYRVKPDTEAIFKDCKSLKSVTILDGVTSIADWAFEGCESLESITIPASVTSIGYRPFHKCSSLASIVVAEGNTVYDSRENCNALIHTATNTLLYGCQNTIIPNGVTSIGDFAFGGCKSLTSIVIPNSVESIGELAFWECDSLKSITIPDGMKSIRKKAFAYCDSLTKVIIPASVTSIEEEAFYYCELRTIRYGGTIAQWKEIAHFRSVVFCRTRVVRCTDGNARQWEMKSIFS